ncbi:MAG: hypothetical protein IT441_02665, partial [Phycisphaeraceae bacterium]|nr:hypothetical protein [Phycisphaeraceae bacterium]
VGGMARYDQDSYYRMSQDTHHVPGNPWFICTLWLAQWRIARAKTIEELRQALPVLDWVSQHALPSGVLAEQVHPETNAPLSVSPLTWSHATVVSVVTAYTQKLAAIKMGHKELCMTGFADPAAQWVTPRSVLPLPRIESLAAMEATPASKPAPSKSTTA